jgi:hypothetical protein
MVISLMLREEYKLTKLFTVYFPRPLVIGTNIIRKDENLAHIRLNILLRTQDGKHCLNKSSFLKRKYADGKTDSTSVFMCKRHIQFCTLSLVMSCVCTTLL